MDLSLSEEQQSIADLSGQILRDKLPPQRLRQIETDPSGRWFADDVWNELAKADLLGLCLPESVGGGGYGFMEACLLLEQQGRAVAPLPILPTLVLGAMPIAQYGSATQQQAVLPGVVSGATILTAALYEDGEYVVPDVPATTATAEGDRWRLDGEKILVPAAHLASLLVVPARTGGTTGVFLVDASDCGIELERNEAINDEPTFLVRFRGATGELLGALDQGEEIVDWIVERAIAALCAVQTGVCEAAVRLTADYVSEREQFGSKIGTFQAVAQRIADAYIDTEGIRLTARQAAWRLSEHLPATDEVHIAKYWASFGGDRVVHAAQHLHGGVGMDLDYPIHRYFRWSKVIELTLGTATEHLRRLGQRIAAAP
ncbi:MAG TPA: acyl-CoA dehydrogenase family protein [Acidimicrobiales bacterium]|jgi:alkylation response protein AidB-like acyl-CoA dehydrogenase|nr:acyl-CoA dehydrogenase family protein [Acidimicrobiales bacterium]